MLTFRITLCCTLLFILTSCTTMKSSDEEDKMRQIKTAKINAQLGIAYLERNNIQRAKQKLMLALSQAADIPETWYSMAYFLEATGNKAAANQYYTKAIHIAPERGDAHNNYGTFLCRTGHYQAAVREFLLAVSDQNYLDPADAYENAGLCAKKLTTYTNQAIFYFNQALVQDPSRPVSLINLAGLYYKKGDLRRAKRNLDQFHIVSPANSYSNLLMKQIQTKMYGNKIADNKVSAFVPQVKTYRILPLKKVASVSAISHHVVKKPLSQLADKNDKKNKIIVHKQTNMVRERKLLS